MRRIAIGAVTALAVWFGNAYAAEAQTPTITSSGPTCIYAGATSSTYTANVYLPTPCAYRLVLTVKKNGVQIHSSETIIGNPGTQNSTVSKIAAHPNAPSAGDTVVYTAAIKISNVLYSQVNWTLTCLATRPTSTKVETKSASLALESIDRDRRRE